MLISIAVPVYNASETIDQCVQSIIEQTFKEYELILVNDGSTDNSLDRCRYWEKKYPNTIRVIDKENSGSLLTRRKCFEESKGDYLYIIDADDYLLDNNALKKIHDIIIKTGADLVLFEATVDIRSMSRFFKYEYVDHNTYGFVDKKTIYHELIRTDRLNALWNKVFKRELVDWHEDYSKYSYITNGTDLFQTIPIISKANSIVFYNKVLYFYRTKDNNSSIVHHFNPNTYISLKTSFLRLLEASKNWGLKQNSLEIEFANRFMLVASTCAYKVRLIEEKGKKESESYLATIGGDRLFRYFYKRANLNKLTVARRTIVKMLYRHMYSLLTWCIRIIGHRQ